MKKTGFIITSIVLALFTGIFLLSTAMVVVTRPISVIHFNNNVVEGMTKENVIDFLGNPRQIHSRNMNEKDWYFGNAPFPENEVFVYRVGDYRGLVYFKEDASVEKIYIWNIDNNYAQNIREWNFDWEYWKIYIWILVFIPTLILTLIWLRLYRILYKKKDNELTQRRNKDA